MDPDANLTEQRRLAVRILRAEDVEQPISAEDAARLASLVLALAEWIERGGFVPAVWAAGQKR